MNQITEAFMQAGVKVPSTMQRMWTIIKEEGPITARALTKRLPAIPSGTISSKLHDLEARGMIYSRGAKATSGFGRSAVKEYMTDMTQYTLLPVAKKPEPKPLQAVATPPAREPMQVTLPAAPTVPSVDHLTIAQARELYAVLHKMFGGK